MLEALRLLLKFLERNWWKVFAVFLVVVGLVTGTFLEVLEWLKEFMEGR